ncbi:MAG: hypothetical protein M1836_006664 [Candelina mexicana]|nr:MAG: hypothetical protein M1836_006664 [Candelina mexicana]
MSTPPFRVKAVFDYSSPHEDDLNFTIGQIITVTEEEDSDWYSGEYFDASGNKRDGIFPRNFVERYEPATPPRPTRAIRPSKEPAASLTVQSTSSQVESELEGHEREIAKDAEPSLSTTLPSPQSSRVIKNAQGSTTDTPTAATSSSVTVQPPNEIAATAPRPTELDAGKSAPPMADKPAGGSFRDRIAAFNKPAAPPVAPVKPGSLGTSSGSSFIKKPFVPPPPSKNAYVPPPREPAHQKPYQREDDAQTSLVTSPKSEDPEGGSTATSAFNATHHDDEVDQPKPTSLKDRIALLQKQQLEQAARRSEASPQKDKVQRPPQRGTEPQDHVQAVEQLSGPVLGEPGDEDEQPSTGYAQGAVEIPIRSSYDAQSAREQRHPTTLSLESRDPPSDANDADQSAAGETTEDLEDISTGHAEDVRKQRDPIVSPRMATTTRFSDDNRGGVKSTSSDEEVEAEEEIDPAVKRRMEIRERMAKMSGGMGMYGMFGPPPGITPGTRGPSQKQKPSGSIEKRSLSGHDPDTIASIASPPEVSPMPLRPMPGMRSARAPNEEDGPALVERDSEGAVQPETGVRKVGEVSEGEDLETGNYRSSSIPDTAPVEPHGRPVPVPPPSASRAAPSPTTENRPVPPLPPLAVPMSPSPGSESDDELSLHKQIPPPSPLARNRSKVEKEQGSPISPGGAPAVPHRPETSHSPQSPSVKHTSYLSLEESPASSAFSQTNKRSSRAPPIPGSNPVVSPPLTTRPPPPPPPTAGSLNRKSTVQPVNASTGHEGPLLGSRDDEVTDYDGDYDTDIASSAGHKDALKAHAKESKNRTIGMNMEVSARAQHPAPVDLSPPVTAYSTSRPVPPPPPSQPPKVSRHSMDMPRSAPPPIPPPQKLTEEPDSDVENPYQPPGRPSETFSNPGSSGNTVMPEGSDEYGDDLHSATPPRQSMQQPPPLPSQQAPPPLPYVQNVGSAGSASLQLPPPRQSLETQRMQPSARRSMDQPRTSNEHGYIAANVDLGFETQWWVQPNLPPPVFQQRQDLIYEVEESTSSKRGGKTTVSKDVYVLFTDYSQTVVTARYDPREPADANLEQRHEPPPPRSRQDQLEEAHRRFGQHIAEGAMAKQNTVVSDGRPHSLILELLEPLQGTLRPVGIRAYGALVYANLANASTQQYDEIRAGDIITLRNARFQGHRGPMHQKYVAEAGKPDHVGVVVDWDGTKKKVRAWEQGRESRKVKMESFKLGDLRSGEVKIWRVMPRSWVGWEGQD